MGVSVVDGSMGLRPGEELVDLRAVWRSYAAISMRDSREAVGILTPWGYHLNVSYIRDYVVEGGPNAMAVIVFHPRTNIEFLEIIGCLRMLVFGADVGKHVGTWGGGKERMIVVKCSMDLGIRG